MHIVQANNNDKDRWDHFIQHQGSASPYHLFAWKIAIEKAYGFKSLYLIALDDEKKILGVLPSIIIKTPFKKEVLCSLPYCDHGEAIASSNEIKDQLLLKARDLMHQRCKLFDYRNTEIDYLEAEQINENISVSKVRMLFSLPETSDALLKGFKTKLRSQIKKAEKNGLTYIIGNNEHLLNQFYQVFTTNMRDLGSPTHSYRWFKEITHHFDSNCIISIVYKDDIPIGAGIVLMQGVTAVIPWASTLRKYNRLSPNMLLYWSLLKQVTDQGYKQFDFGRSTLGEGTYKFKKQWGAKAIALNWQQYDLQNFDLIKPLTDDKPANSSKSKMRETIENIWRKLPLNLTIILGSRIRKYISL